MAALSPRDVWAVGSGLETYAPANGPPLIEHWNGTQWSIVTSPNPSANDNSLASVAALAPNDVWAVGNYRSSTGTSCCVHLPLIERWDGTAWHIVANPALPGAIDSTLTTVATIPGTKQLWAVGSVLYDHPASHPALIERWDGTAWHLVATPALPSDAARSGTLSGVVALSPTDAWAVGEYSARNLDRRALIEHWNGTAWQVVSIPDACASSMSYPRTTLLSVTATGARDVRAPSAGAAALPGMIRC